MEPSEATTTARSSAGGALSPIRSRLAAALPLALVICVLFATGCTGRVQASPRPTGGQAPSVGAPKAVLDAVLADAKQQTGVAVSALKLLSAEAVTWSDGSLGCPDPGRRYTEALVPGHRIRIDAHGRVLDYHTSARGAVRLCPTGRAVPPLPADAAAS